MKNLSHPYHKLRVALYELGALLDFGCGDGNCKIAGRRPGMHTNGGCKCIESLSDLALNVSVEAEKVKRIHCGQLSEFDPPNTVICGHPQNPVRTDGGLLQDDKHEA